MKRKFLTVLLALVAALCLCFGLVACGETPTKPQDPPAKSETIEGYWTGATAEVSISSNSDPTEMSFAASVKLVGDTAYVVFTMTPATESSVTVGRIGYALSKQENGSYSFTYDPQNDVGHVAGKLNADNKLEIISDMWTQTETTLTFTAKTALPAGLGLTGTWYELTSSDGVDYTYTAGKNHYDFNDKKLYTFDTEQDITVVEVGNYTLFTYTGHMPQVIYKSGNDYFVDDMYIKLTQTAPATPVPPATESIEGVWTGGEGIATGAAITIDVDGDAAYMVVKLGEGYFYSALTEAEDGGFSHTIPGEATVTLKLNAENKLEYKSIPAAGAPSEAKEQTIVFPDKAALPSALNITGTKYAVIDRELLTVNFGAATTFSLGNKAATQDLVVNVGGYKVITGTVGAYPTEPITIVVFEGEAEALSAYVNVGKTPYGGSIYTLLDEEPTPATTIEGVWTGGIAELHYSPNQVLRYAVAATVDVDGESARAIYSMVDTEGGMAEETPPCDYLPLEKQTDGSYKYEVTNGSGTSTFEFKMIDNKLQTVISNLFPGEPVVINFTTKTELPAAPVITGTKYTTHRGNAVEIDFGSTPAIKYGETSFTDVQIFDVGAYKLLTGKYNTKDASIIITEDGEKTYAHISLSPLEREIAELTDTKSVSEYSFEGVWTGAVAGILQPPVTIDCAFTVAIMVDGGYARAIYSFAALEGGVAGETISCDYLLLEKQTDDFYKYEMTNGNRVTTFEFKMIDDKLQIVVTNMYPNPDPVVLNFTTRTELSAALEITGAKYTQCRGKAVEIDFGDTLTVKHDGTYFTDVEVFDVGAYKLITGTYNAQDASIIIVKEGEKTYAYISLLPFDTEKCELTDIAPASSPSA